MTPPELTEEDFALPMPSGVRRRLVEGELKSGANVAARHRRIILESLRSVA